MEDTHDVKNAETWIVVSCQRDECNQYAWFVNARVCGVSAFTLGRWRARELLSGEEVVKEAYSRAKRLLCFSLAHHMHMTLYTMLTAGRNAVSA